MTTADGTPGALGHTRPLADATRFAPGAAASVALLVSWFVFVRTGDQLAYVACAAASALTAVELGRRRSPLLLWLVLWQIGFVGTEVNGTLGAGTPPLRSLRLLDVTLAAGVVGVVLATGRRGTLVAARSLAGPGRRLLAGAGLLLLGWLVVGWAASGLPRDAVTMTDLRLVLIVGASVIVGLGVRLPRGDELLVPVALLALTIAGKSLALYVIDYWMIGTYDRVQAASVSGGGDALRVILVGGDTLLILAPAVLAVLLRGARGASRALGSVAFAASAAALLASGTRTSLLVALVLLAVVALASTAQARGASLPGRRTLALALVALVAFIGAAVASGVVSRFVNGDGPGSGLAFRADEARSFLDLPPAKLLLGQGLGGRFVGTTSTGQATEAGWSHAWPIWLALKTGLLSLVLWIAALALLARSAVRRLRSTDPSIRQAALACSGGLLGLVLMSFTLGRVGLPEGIATFAVATVLLLRLPSPTR